LFSQHMDRRKYIKKVSLLGEGAVGKTSLVRRYVLDVFSDDYLQTFGAKVTKKVMDVEDIELTMMIWDILGQKSQKSLHATYYSGSNGVLVVFDLTRKETLLTLPEWADDFRKTAGNVPIIMIANKMDLVNDTSIDLIKNVEKAIDATNLVYTSAKTGEGVQEAFELLSKKMMGGS
jgi:small GTP-binding protein